MGDDELVAKLISEGAQIDTRDGDGWTPLHKAAAYGNERSVSALLNAASERYKREIYETCTTTYWFSFPAQMIGFRFCPGHLRIPYVACCSMVFTSLVSGLQGRFRARERGEKDG